MCSYLLEQKRKKRVRDLNSGLQRVTTEREIKVRLYFIKR